MIGAGNGAAALGVAEHMTREKTVPAALRDEREAVENRIHGLRRELASMLDGTTSNDDEHDPEGATVAYERAQVSSLLDRALRERDELELAVRRVQEGHYGTCERCAARIGPQRLEALPAARRCVDCATRR